MSSRSLPQRPKVISNYLTSNQPTSNSSLPHHTFRTRCTVPTSKLTMGTRPLPSNWDMEQRRWVAQQSIDYNISPTIVNAFRAKFPYANVSKVDDESAHRRISTVFHHYKRVPIEKLEAQLGPLDKTSKTAATGLLKREGRVKFDMAKAIHSSSSAGN